MDVLVRIEHGSELASQVDIAGMCAFAMACEGLPDDAEVSVTLVDNDEMARLNQQYRGKQGPTDVLSFECDNLDDEMSGLSGDGQPYQLGDIVIAPDVAAGQASEFGTTPAAELELLLVHGILHLCGWDHLVDEEAEAMEAREAQILSKWARR